jgi:isopenicillin N synthase-like dioxygenase
MDMIPAHADFDAIPVVDFALITSSDLRVRIAAAATLREVCTRVGFFYLGNHGVPQPMIDGCFEAARRYFAQSTEQKMATHISKSEHHRGYGAMLEERTDAKGGPDLHEAFDLSHDVPADDPEVLAGCWLSGPNAWPDPAPPGFRAALENYYAAMLTLGRRLFGGFALALGLDEAFFEPMLDRPGSFMRVLHYPPQPPHGEAGESMGIGAHSDYECFTILAQDDVGGLEVRNARGQWIAAVPMPGCFVINIGDMMARWTNDLFASTLHRVINRSGRERTSIPFFYGIDYDVTLETLPACVSPDRPQRYAPVNAHDYVAGRIKGSYALYEPAAGTTTAG